MFSSLTNFVAKTINPHTEVTQQAQYSLNSIPYDKSENFRLFESKYFLQSIVVSADKWFYYDTGGDKIPLILIPGTTGTAKVFFQQLLSLGLRGYRLISVTIPSTPTVELFIKSFNKFLIYLNIDEFHLLGTSLGGYLALSYTSQYPSRVLSLILTNAFINTQLYQANAPWLSSDIMPEFYLRRYITGALPNNKQQSIHISLAIDFVLKEINTLTKQQLSSRLALNFSKHMIDKVNLNYPQENINIIEVYDITSTALHQTMKEQLYNLLNNARNSLMKCGGDFPYLSNYEEYTMLIHVHLRRHMEQSNIYKYNGMASNITPQNDENVITNLFQTKARKNNNKKHKLQTDLLGVFDHRRQYHNAQKESLFRDDGNQHKDGAYIENGNNSDSSQSSNMMEVDHTEHDKRKSLLFTKSYQEDEDEDEENDDDDDSEPCIVGISSKEIFKGKENKKEMLYYVENGNVNENHTEFYVINEDKKRQYLLDKKVKKIRYKEYLSRKKKAYKRHLAHKQRQESKNEDGDGNENGNVHRKKHKTKHKHKHKHTQKGKKKVAGSKHKRKQKRDKNGKISKIKKKSVHREKQQRPQQNSVEMRKSKMLQYYKQKKMAMDMRQHIMAGMGDNDAVIDHEVAPQLNKYTTANRTVVVNNESENLQDMLYKKEKDIIISPRHSFTEQIEVCAEEAEEEENGAILNENRILDEMPKKHRKEKSILDTLPMQPISEEDSEEKTDEKRENENESTIMKERENAPETKHKTRVSRHRALRAKHYSLDDEEDNECNNDLDQTPMDLVNIQPRPTTVGGHRYIPSYDSNAGLSNFDESKEEAPDMTDMTENRIRSESYVPLVFDDIQRQDSFISELGDFGFLPSEIQPWPMEGDTPVNNEEHKIQETFPSNYLLTEHKVDEDDENVGDSIF